MFYSAPIPLFPTIMGSTRTVYLLARAFEVSLCAAVEGMVNLRKAVS